MRYASLCLIGSLAAIHTAVALADKAAGLDTSVPEEFLTEPAANTGETPAQEQQRQHCTELAREIEALKGKPLRRSAAVKRHKAECQSDVRPASTAPATRVTPPGDVPNQ